MVPVCDECGGQLKHGFRIGTVECTNCGKIWEDETDTFQNKSYKIR